MIRLKALLLLLSFIGLSFNTSAQKSNSENNLGVSKSYALKKINQVRTKGCQCGNTYFKPVPQLKWNETLEYSA